MVWSKGGIYNFTFYLSKGLLSSNSIRSAYGFVMKGIFASKFGGGNFCG